jgi:hypothetical protein
MKLVRSDKHINQKRIRHRFGFAHDLVMTGFGSLLKKSRSVPVGNEF